MSEDMREAFERWHDGLFDISATTVVKNEYGYPQNAVIQMRWQTWQAATASTEAKWRGVVEKATALCDQMARDGYQNAKLEAVRELREALVQAEKLMGRKQMTQKPDNPQAMTYEQLTKPDIDLPRYPAWKVTVNDLGCKRESIMTQAEFDKWRIEQWSIKS